ADDHVVLINTHHIVFDGWSIAIVIRELIAPYSALLAGDEAAPLPSPPLQYADFAAWQRRWLSERRTGGEELERQLVWWRQHLGSPPPPPVGLAPDHPRREGELPWAGYRFLLLSETTSNALRRLASEQGATLFMIMLAAYQTLLHRHTGAGAVVVGTPIANRHRYEIEQLVGFFVNTLALGSDFADDPPFRELVARLRESTLGAYAHQDLPFEKVVEALQPDRSAGAGAQALFKAFFAFQNAPMPPLEMPGLVLRPLPLDPGRRSPFFELVLGMSEQGERLGGSLDYDATLFDEATIDA
ncbi:MAG: non-ribosomal peptide synthetase, partial [bacterium]|nr:non-ribosomal peptide synthetase [bacterium]